MLKKLLGSSWRSSLLGYLVAAGQMAYDAYQSGGVTLKGALVSAVIAIAGRIVKDATATGSGANATNSAPGTAAMIGESKVTPTP